MLIHTNKIILCSFLHKQKWSDEGIEFAPGSHGMMWGPYISLEPGDYICRVSISHIGNNPDTIFTYDVCADHRKIIIERSPLSRDEQGLYFNLLLDESEDNIEFRLYYSGEQCTTVTGFLISKRDKHQPMKMLADTFLTERSEALFKQIPRIRADSKKSDEEVRILQTADANRYSKILAESSTINKAYCQRWRLTYEAFSGIIFGEKPFQAMYNRTALLWFLMKRGYRGWVLYMDADAAICDFDFDFKGYLLSKRNEGKYFVFHPVHAEGHSLQFFGNINSGVFAVDFSSPIAQAMVSIWYSFYREFYVEKDYAQAKQWTDLVDDQESLQRILFINRKFLKPYIEFDGIQQTHVFQAVRSDGSSESSMDDLERRISVLHELCVKLTKE